MSLDQDPVKLTGVGTVVIRPCAIKGGVEITFEGFQASGATCRDVAVLAAVWAIGALQRELMKDIEQPGGGSTAIG